MKLVTAHWALFLYVVSCGDPEKQREPSFEVVVYTALDREFSEPIFARFTEKTGISVRPQFDTESTKTIGLTARLMAERARPRADVFWNNEILHTLRLVDEGLVEPCEPQAAAAYPESCRDPSGRWFGFAARARVLIVNTELVGESERPSSIRDLANPRWRGQTGIAKPLFGTTASHIACLFAVLGQKATEELLDAMRANDIQIHGGNKGCAQAVSAGSCAFALTDTDDAMVELAVGAPVTIVYPDQVPVGGIEPMGTLFLPNTLCRIAGSHDSSAAEALINYLLSAEVEAALAACPSAQIPLRIDGAGTSPRIPGPSQMRPMQVDWAAAARLLPRALESVESRFLQ